MGCFSSRRRHRSMDEIHPFGWWPPLPPTLCPRRRTSYPRNGCRNPSRRALNHRKGKGTYEPITYSSLSIQFTVLIKPGIRPKKQNGPSKKPTSSNWVSSGIDALLLPVTPWVGYKPKTWVKSFQWLGYTALYNLLNYAAVTVPVIAADEELDTPENDKEWAAHVPRNESDRFNYEQCMLLFLLVSWCLLLHRG